MIITISGLPGAGKTSVAEILAKKLDYKYYYMGQIMRNMAKERGKFIKEFYKDAEKDPSIDKDLDAYQKKLGETEDGFVIQGRTSFYFIPHSVKVYLSVSEDEGARRIFEDLKKNKDRNEEICESIDELKKNLRERVESEIKRYTKLYGFDHTDTSHYDLVIDTTHLTIDETADKILGFIGKK